MSQFVFRNFNLLDPRWDEPRGGYEVLVEGETIKEVSNKPIKARPVSDTLRRGNNFWFTRLSCFHLQRPPPLHPNVAAASGTPRPLKITINTRFQMA